MDVTAIAATASTLSQAKLADAVATSVLKKSIDIQADMAAQLLQALPQPLTNPPNLGQRIDIKA